MHLRNPFITSFFSALLCTMLFLSYAECQQLKTNQRGNLILSSFGFGKSGGASVLNHPSGIAVLDGNLVVADRNNNRVLVWSGVPTSYKTKPKLVLGQKNFKTNLPGSDLKSLNWPTAVAAAGTKLFVADAYNNRILVWNTVPTKSGQAADFALTSVTWPWGVWTNGDKLMATSTLGSKVVVWRSIPSSDIAPDVELASSVFGTPRSVISDGTNLIVSDHNAKSQTADRGTFFWDTFPTSNSTSPSVFMHNFQGATSTSTEEYEANGAVFMDDGRLLTLGGEYLCVWNGFPNSTDLCPLLVSKTEAGGFQFKGGDNSGITTYDGKVLVSLCNANKVVVYNSVPTAQTQSPDYTIMAKTLSEDSLKSNALITNPVPHLHKGKLIVVSDFDRTVSIWNSVPTESAVKPDKVISVDMPPWDITSIGKGIAMVGHKSLFMWNKTPKSGTPDTNFTNSLGSVQFDNLLGVTYNGTYFILSDNGAGKIYIYQGIPTSASEPVATLSVTSVGRVHANADYLAATTFDGPGGGVLIYSLSGINSSSTPLIRLGSDLNIYRMNLPEDVLFYKNSLYISDTGFHRTLVWRNISDALAGNAPNVYLGDSDSEPATYPSIAANRLFWPAGLAHDGKHLWIGEYKFSNRLVGFKGK